jgi:hypothetical protein
MVSKYQLDQLKATSDQLDLLKAIDDRRLEQQQVLSGKKSAWKKIPRIPDTLRDQFAIAALTGYLGNSMLRSLVNRDELALSAYKYADAMMIAREKKYLNEGDKK